MYLLLEGEFDAEGFFSLDSGASSKHMTSLSVSLASAAALPLALFAPCGIITLTIFTGTLQKISHEQLNIAIHTS